MNTLVVFLKNPILGKVKTRLAATAGEEFALELYHQLLSCCSSIIREINCEKKIYFTDFSDNKIMQPYQKRLQNGADLGERMLNAIAQEFSEGASKVVLIGTDCPALTPEIIEEAFIRLAECDVVIGPAADGGYYLIGMKKTYPEVFNDIKWSSEVVLSSTINKVKDIGLNFHLLPVLNDIDTANDLYSSLKNNSSKSL